MSVGGIPFQSKLESYFDLIVAARRRRKTWAQIAELIKEQGTDITRQGVVIFFKTRKKRDALRIEPTVPEAPAPAKHPAAQAESPNGESDIESKPVARRIPKIHAKPYQSPLWKHLETIRTLRRRHETWAEIALHLEDAHGLKVSRATVLKFFERTTGGRVPLGFSNTKATRDLQKPNPAGSGLRQTIKPFEDSDGDPFSTKTIPFDPWKPRSATYE